MSAVKRSAISSACWHGSAIAAVLVTAPFIVHAMAVVTHSPAVQAARPASAAPIPSGVLWFIFIDDLHIDFPDTGHLRQLLVTISTELFQEGDEFLARSSGPSQLSIDRTPDLTRLENARRTVTANGLKASDIVHVAPRDLGLDELRYRAALSMASACEAIRNLEPINDRRKAFIYVSNGYSHTDFAPGPGCDEVSEITRAARQAGVTVFAIDARLLGGIPTPDPNMDSDAWHAYRAATQASLRRLSGETGGFAFVDSEDVVGALRNIRRAMRD